MFGGITGGLVEPHGIAVAAAVFYVARHRLDKGAQPVFIDLCQLQADGLGIFPQTVPPGAVFRKGVDVGVVPKPHGLDPLRPELLDTGHRAGGTANMEQKFHKIPSFSA